MCLVGCLALFFPRIAMALVWAFGPGYLERALHPWYWLVLGFLFLPTTSLAFAYSMNSLAPAGDVPPLGWVLVGVGALIDLGLFGNGARSSRRRRDDEDDD